ncbi:hypothetical protein [Clostridium ljungdahlii]|uniref:hypothetical protein n=1 Tax=Clostridium ljungdahlii TaxID=1538 RepID=UPI003867F9BA
MKITAEFNSNEELLSFISTFGAKDISKTVAGPIGANRTATTNKSEVKEAPKIEVAKENKKEDVKKEDKKEVEESKNTKEDRKEDPKITKEMVRAVFTKIIKAGKQKKLRNLLKNMVLVEFLK